MTDHRHIVVFKIKNNNKKKYKLSRAIILYQPIFTMCLVNTVTVENLEKTEMLINPFMPSGLFYLKSLDKSVSCLRGVWLVFIIVNFRRIF